PNLDLQRAVNQPACYHRRLSADVTDLRAPRPAPRSPRGFHPPVPPSCRRGLGLVGVSLLLGMAGYHFLEGLSWLDGFLNAAMLLGGMGPVAPLQTPAGKLFAGFYALYAGLLFITVAGLL